MTAVEGVEGPLLLAEDLLLLFVDDETGKIPSLGVRTDYALAGALLIELALAEAVQVSEPTGLLRHRNVEVVPGAAPAVTDPLLAKALSQIADKARTAESLVPVLSKGLRGRLLERLEGRGILRHEQGHVLKIFPVDRWPAVDSSHERITRQRLRDVLVVGAQPDAWTAALVSLLSAVDQATAVVGSGDRAQAKEIKARAKEIAEGSWVPQAVRKAVDAVNAAVMVAVTAATVTATATS